MTSRNSHDFFLEKIQLYNVRCSHRFRKDTIHVGTTFLGVSSGALEQACAWSKLLSLQSDATPFCIRDYRADMAAALSAVRRKNKKQSYCLGEPEVTLSERVPPAADCIKNGEVERLTHRWYANCPDSV